MSRTHGERVLVIAAPLGANTTINVFDEHVENVIVGSGSNDPRPDGRDASLFIAVYIAEHQQFLLRAVGPDREVFVMALEPHLVDSAYCSANRSSSHSSARLASQVRHLDHLVR